MAATRRRLAVGFRQRCQDHAAIVEQRRKCSGRAAVLGACDGVAGHERAQPRAECVARSRDHVLLRAAGVGDACAGPEVRGDRCKQRRELRHGCGDQHDVGVTHLGAPRLVERQRAVDHLALDGGVEIRARAADADHLAHDARTLQRQRTRSADEPDADDEELVRSELVRPSMRPGGRAVPPEATSSLPSAGEEALVLLGRPTEMRSHSGNA